MGDIGDYWRDHKEHKRLVARRKLGISVSDERRMEREEAKKKKQDENDEEIWM